MDFINIVMLAWISVPLKMPGLRKAFLRTQSFIQTQLISKLIVLLHEKNKKKRKKRFGASILFNFVGWKTLVLILY